MKPLFVPLKSKYFDAFADGTKSFEYRAHGPRWNSATVRIGRRVTLSRGYGKQARLHGTISKIELRTDLENLPPGFRDCYPTATEAIVFKIDLDRCPLCAGNAEIESERQESFRDPVTIEFVECPLCAGTGHVQPKQESQL